MLCRGRQSRDGRGAYCCAVPRAYATLMWAFILFLLRVHVNSHECFTVISVSCLFCYRLSPGINDIGRHSQNKFCLVSPTNPCLISRQHAKIEFHVEVINNISYPLFSLSDSSLNGTYLNDRRVRAIAVAA